MAAVVVESSIYASPVMFGVVAFFFVLTAVAALVPWDSIDRNWGKVLPFVNLVGILLLREFAPATGI